MSSTPSLHFTVNGTETYSLIASIQLATNSGLFIIQAPNDPQVTHGEGHPQFKLTSS